MYLSLEDFGRELLDKNDLDPVYNVLYGAKLERPQLRRWLLAYWCCYSAGEASWISGQLDFWSRMREMAFNKTEAPTGGRWPRGRERRHFRGDKAVEAIDWLARRYPNPEDVVQHLEIPGAFQVISRRVQEWPMFGPWIAFKVGDMMERVLGVNVDFSGSDVFFFKSPREAAELWYSIQSGLENSKHAIPEACSFLASYFGDRLAPPSYNRRLNFQEYETILCKWGSHMTGHYPIGIDTRELREALHPWAGVSRTALSLYKELAHD
jgi:hypothetical protein